MSAFEFPLHCLRPWWWLALAPLPLVLWLLARNVGGRAVLARLADAILLPHLVHATSARQRVALGLVALTWLVAVTALSGPAWQKISQPLYVNGAARVVALSLSDDMLAQDVLPDRMTRARFAVHDLLDAAGDARTALVAYAGAAFTVAPLTDDKRTVLNLLRALRPNVMPVPGNDAAAGIRQSVRLLQQAHVKGGEIVLVTDTAEAAAVAAARAAYAQGIRVDVLGVGTTQGAPLPQSGGGFASGAQGVVLARRNDAALRAVARAGGGRYAVLDAGGVAAFRAPPAQTGHASSGQRAQLWRDGGIWLLPILLVLAALAFRRGWLLVLAVLILPIGIPAAHAASWNALFANRDQQALQALQRGDAAQAQKLAASPGMRGAADYRAGAYAEAAKAFAKGENARSHYNLGNALAMQRKYPQALAAYRKALQLDPKLADARANLDAVEAWLKHHQHAAPQAGQKKQTSSPTQPRSSAGANASKGERPRSSAQQHAAPHAGTQPTQTSPTQQQGASGNKSSTAARTQGEQGSSSSASAQQRRQLQQARQGLAHELGQARKSSQASEHAFALGQTPPPQDGHFNAQQRALLQAVPDDPGALLRRKFKLEWEQRNGQQQEDGQP